MKNLDTHKLASPSFGTRPGSEGEAISPTQPLLDRVAQHSALTLAALDEVQAATRSIREKGDQPGRRRRLEIALAKYAKARRKLERSIEKANTEPAIREERKG